MPKVSVTLSDEVHAAVRVRAFREGVTLDALGRAFFERYGNGLSAGEQPGTGSGWGRSVALPSDAPGETPPPVSQAGRPAPAERPFQPDWKKGKR